MNSPSLTGLLRKYQADFYPVIPFQPEKEKLVLFDFTENNSRLTADKFNDTALFSAYIDEQLRQQHARYGIGGYGEHRTIYSRSNIFDGEQPGDEPRRFHLGMDIWGEAGTPLSAPLDGIVHSFAFNNQRGDYGTTIILEHNLKGSVFHALYGHLGLASIQDMKEGKKIKEGEVFAWTGIPAENGQWPSHLHFQLIQDIGDHRGDYPGVCRFSERVYYLENCPDPDLLLQLNRYIGG